jgi:GMP synthase-like glutamine amidotransferase
MDNRASPDVLVVENGRDRGEAIARIAKAAGFDVLLARPYLGEGLPPPEWARMIVLTGGPASVCDPRQSNSPFLSAVLDFTREAIGRWTPIIGICLGQQLIARALNGNVVRSASMEVGIRRIHPVLSPVSENPDGDGGLQAFAFHRDHVSEPPPGCILTFRSEGCAVEGFRHSDRPIHSMQFHPEIGSQQAQAILKWWYSGNRVKANALADAAAFDARPAHHLLLNLLKQYTGTRVT